jgi:hypothetical protein
VRSWPSSWTEHVGRLAACCSRRKARELARSSVWGCVPLCFCLPSVFRPLHCNRLKHSQRFALAPHPHDCPCANCTCHCSAHSPGPSNCAAASNLPALPGLQQHSSKLTEVIACLKLAGNSSFAPTANKRPASVADHADTTSPAVASASPDPTVINQIVCCSGSLDTSIPS